MHLSKSSLGSACCAVILLATASIARATNFSAVIVYGDSLSDNGNLYNAIGYPPSPYYNGRFSNGPVAVEQLASRLNSPLIDFAWGGATTGLGNYIDGGGQTSLGGYGLPGMQIEVAASGPPIIPGALYVVWGGANDFFTLESPTVAAANVDAYVQLLKNGGATHILVPGVPDLGLTPEFYGVPVATAYSVAFNTALQAGLPSGAKYVDTFDLLQAIFANPGAYGLSNVTTPCFDGTSVCANQSQYLFWDGVHPTTAADGILADAFYTAATPEPSMFLLMGTGLLGLIIMMRRAIA